MLIIYLIRFCECIIHHFLDISQCVCRHSQELIKSAFEAFLIFYKRPRYHIQNIPADLSGQFVYAHLCICKNAYQIGGCLLCVLSSKCGEDICCCLSKISLNRHDLGAYIKHRNQMLLDPLFVLIQVFVDSAQDIGCNRYSNACHGSCLLPQ